MYDVNLLHQKNIYHHHPPHNVFTMNPLKALLVSALALPALAVFADHERSGNSVTVHPSSGAARTVRLQMVNDRIIRVEQTPASEIPKKKTSLVVIPQTVTPTFSVEEDEGSVRIIADGIRASVSKADGHIAFSDGNGKPLLAEKHKAFQPFVSPQTQLPETYRPSSPEEIGWGKDRDAHILSLDDRTGWSWNVRFSSPDDEAIYGLGQHQSEEMNYKGRNEELFQYNTKVSVPFVVSTAGYGLLWDSKFFWLQLIASFCVSIPTNEESPLFLSLVVIVMSVVNLVLTMKLYIRLAHAFGKGTGFGVLTYFFAPICLAVLGFGSAEYRERKA